MKVVFLDIDGVMNRLDQPIPYGFRTLPAILPEKVVLLNKLTEVTQSGIVLSTSWRYLFTIEGWNDHFANLGIKARVIGCTLKNTESVQKILLDHTGEWKDRIYRGDEINAWVCESLYDSDSFVILDDGTDMAPLDKFLVNTDGDTGLTEEDVQKAIGILNATH